MPLSTIQKGAVGQFAFLAVALVTGKGEVEIYIPAIDNEGRDAEVRKHLQRKPGIGIQIKVSLTPTRFAKNPQKYLAIQFRLAKKKLQNDPRLWYFLALYDTQRMQFAEPVYLVPAAVFHKLAWHKETKGIVEFHMYADLGPHAKDRWTSYRLPLKDLGKRLLKIIDTPTLPASRATLILPEGAILISLKKQRATRATSRAA